MDDFIINYRNNHILRTIVSDFLEIYNKTQKKYEKYAREKYIKNQLKKIKKHNDKLTKGRNVLKDFMKTVFPFLVENLFPVESR